MDLLGFMNHIGMGWIVIINALVVPAIGGTLAGVIALVARNRFGLDLSRRHSVWIAFGGAILTIPLTYFWFQVGID